MKVLYIVLGVISLILGVVGAFLPVIPTTPFAILAAFFFSKSSPRMEQFILDLPALGPLVREWRENRVIRPYAKFASVLMIILVMGSSLYFAHPPPWAQIVMVLIGISVIIFILTRKSYK